MVSLAQLLARHRCLLVLDAASARVQVGLLRADAPAVWQTSADEAGHALFSLTDAVLRSAGAQLADIGAFVFCTGPGSMLGVRTVAMALRTWQTLEARPVYTYTSLPLLARQIAAAEPGLPFAVISDARRDSWNCVRVDPAGEVSPLMRVTSTEVAAFSGTIFCPTAFRSFAPAPAPARDFPYDVAAALAQFESVALFAPTDAPDAFQHEAPEYKKWSAQVHSAANATK